MHGTSQKYELTGMDHLLLYMGIFIYYNTSSETNMYMNCCKQKRCVHTYTKKHRHFTRLMTYYIIIGSIEIMTI